MNINLPLMDHPCIGFSFTHWLRRVSPLIINLATSRGPATHGHYQRSSAVTGWRWLHSQAHQILELVHLDHGTALSGAMLDLGPWTSRWIRAKQTSVQHQAAAAFFLAQNPPKMIGKPLDNTHQDRNCMKTSGKKPSPTRGKEALSTHKQSNHLCSLMQGRGFD